MKKKSYIPENNPHKQNTGLRRLFLAFVNSISGFNFAIKEESAFRQELLLCLFLVPLIFIFPTSPIEKILMIGSLLLLLIVSFPMYTIYQKYFDPLFFLFFFGLVNSDYLKEIVLNKKINLTFIFLYFFSFYLFSLIYYSSV